MLTEAQKLIDAARSNRLQELQELLARLGDIRIASAVGRTPLHAACESGALEAAKLLVNAGVSVNVKMKHEVTPLHIAASFGRCDLIDSDLECNNPWESSGQQKIHPEVGSAFLHILKRKKTQIPDELGPADDIPEERKAEIFLGCFELLMDRDSLLREFQADGFDVDAIDPQFGERLRGNPRYLRLVEFLLEHGSNINVVDSRGRTPLHLAVESGEINMVRLLIERGADINPSTEPQDGNLSVTPIESAIQSFRTEIAALLHQHGATIPFEKLKVLHEVYANRPIKLVKWLLDLGADINQRDEYGNTPLLCAANGDIEAMKLLVEYGADITCRNLKGEGILHRAADYLDCLRYGITLGIPVAELDENGNSPLHNAACSLTVDSIIMLLEAGAPINVKNRDGNTPLHVIFFSDECRPDIEFPTFHCLVTRGANVTLRNKEQKTPHDLAVERGYPPEYLLLLDPTVTEARRPQFVILAQPEYSAFSINACTPVMIDGEIWNSVQHYFQAQKFDEPEERERIRLAPTVSDAIRLGRRAGRVSWPQKPRDEVMRDALSAKFNQHPQLRDKLLATSNALLVEDSFGEAYWIEGAEHNTLGRLLMEIRDSLRTST